MPVSLLANNLCSYGLLSSPHHEGTLACLCISQKICFPTKQEKRLLLEHPWHQSHRTFGSDWTTLIVFAECREPVQEVRQVCVRQRLSQRSAVSGKWIFVRWTVFLAVPILLNLFFTQRRLVYFDSPDIPTILFYG